VYTLQEMLLVAFAIGLTKGINTGPYTGRDHQGIYGIWLVCRAGNHRGSLPR